MLAAILAAVLGTTPVLGISCYDGDTCTADLYIGYGIVLSNQKLRLCDIQAPEVRGKRKADGLRSRDALTERLREGPVWWEPVLNKQGKELKGKYGRWLGWLYVDEVDLNEWMVRSELAKPYMKCPR